MSDPLFSVQDQVVLVSGASRGIGWSIAEAFAKRGASVVITGRQEQTLRAAAQRIKHEASAPGLSPTVVPFVCDVGKRADIEALVPAVVERFGRIDTLAAEHGVDIGNADRFGHALQFLALFVETFPVKEE